MRNLILVGLALALGGLWNVLGDAPSTTWVLIVLAAMVALLTGVSFWIQEFYLPDLTAMGSLFFVLCQWLYLVQLLAVEVNWDVTEIPEGVYIALFGQAMLLFAAGAHWVNHRLTEERSTRS